MSVIYRIMAKPPESNWRISQDGDETEEVAEHPWPESVGEVPGMDRMRRSSPSASHASAISPWKLFIVLLLMICFAIGLFTNWL
jgi:hypothetical protein